MCTVLAAPSSPPPVGDRFADDNGSPHEPSINRLAHALIVTGLADGSSGVAAPLPRDQAATILVRALNLLVGQDLSR